jgi:hypothetical protein
MASKTEPTKDALKAQQRDPYEHLRISFDPAHLVRLHPFMAQHDIRYYLNGVYVEPANEGAYLVVSDGHTLAIIHDKTATITGADHAIISVEPPLVRAAKLATGRDWRAKQARVLVRGQRASVAIDMDAAVHDGEVYIQPGRCVIEGKFPDWRKVLPAFKQLRLGVGTESAHVNCSYLARLEKITRRNCRGITLWHDPTRGAGPVVVQFVDVREMVALIMPMRGDIEDDARGLLPKIAPPRQAIAAPAAGAETAKHEKAEASA